MHYHPFRDNLWLPLLLSVFSGLLGIPVAVGSAGIFGLLSQIAPTIIGASGS